MTSTNLHAKASYTRIVRYYKPQKVKDSSRDNLMQNRKPGEYNGFLSERSKSRIKTITENWLITLNEVSRRGTKLSFQKWANAPSDNGMEPQTSTRKKSRLYHAAPHTLSASEGNIRLPKYERIANKVRPVFLTLTLPSEQNHTDNVIKRECLMPFLQTIKRKFKVVNYLWIAENQKNGNIHFHVIIDRYIPKAQVQYEWNNQLAPLGYIAAFTAKHGSQNPPTTHIESVRNNHKVTSYLTKYITKHESSYIEGRLYGKSKGLEDYKSMPINVQYILSQEEKHLENSLYAVGNEYFTFILLKDMYQDRYLYMEVFHYFLNIALYQYYRSYYHHISEIKFNRR